MDFPSPYIALADLLDRELWPEETLQSSSGGEDALADLACADLDVTRTETSLLVEARTHPVDEIIFGLPFLDAAALVIPGEVDGAPPEVSLRLSLDWSEEEAVSSLRIDTGKLALRFARDLLIPALPDGGRFVPDPDSDHFTEIEIPHSLVVGPAGALELDSGEEALSLSLPPCYIGETGIVVEVSGLVPALSDAALDRLPASLARQGTGIYVESAHLHLPRGINCAIPEAIELTGCFFGAGGISGTASARWEPDFDPQGGVFTGHGSGTIFGIPFGLEQVSLQVRQSALVGSLLRGTLLLPFFAQPVEVEISLGLDGRLGLRLRSEEPIVRTLEDVLQLTIRGLAFEMVDGSLEIVVDGGITPLFPVDGFSWPAIDLSGLVIGAAGEIRLPGGGLDLSRQKAISFGGFHLEISRISFGTGEDGWRWIGFSGALKLVDGLTAGVSVEGLRVLWSDPPQITLNGVGVELDIEDALSFKGNIAFETLANGWQFAGDIELRLQALDFAIDGDLVIGSKDGQTFLYIHLALDLPSGIPLFATGLGLYGFEGLFALNMEPGRAQEQPWYSIEGAGGDWYHHPRPVGVTQTDKWKSSAGALALGAGVSIATLADNGYAFSGRFLLAIVFPGPILLLEGSGDLLTRRSSREQEGHFRGLAVLDGRAGHFLIGLGASYKTGTDGELIDIQADSEAFFDLHDANAWYIHLGEREPRSRRIRAEIFERIFHADAYLSLDPRDLACGAWMDFRWGSTPVRLEAWIATNTTLSFRPVHLKTGLWLHGSLAVTIFRFGFVFEIDATIDAEVFDPFRLRGEFRVRIGLPWPLRDAEITVVLEWPHTNGAPELPEPLQDVAIEHFKTTAAWPLAIQADAETLPDSLPVVPLDARPCLTFRRPITDEARVGINHWPLPTEDRVGDLTVRYALAEVRLDERLATGEWNFRPVPPLSGAWAPMPAMPAGDSAAPGHTKLWLWTRNPFDSLRRTGGSWEEWFSSTFPNYPCLPQTVAQPVCLDVQGLPVETFVSSPWHPPAMPGVVLSWEGGDADVRWESSPFQGLDHSLHLPAGARLEIDLPAAFWCEILLGATGDDPPLNRDPWIEGIDAVHGFIGREPAAEPRTLWIESRRLIRVRAGASDRLSLLRICYLPDPEAGWIEGSAEWLEHLRDELTRWHEEGPLLKPYTLYRLAVTTTTQGTGTRSYAFFRTAGPPGLSPLSIPDWIPEPETFDSGLRDLARYVLQTTPPTVPPLGREPVLYRPFYRGDDMEIELDETYVPTMYGAVERDLVFGLFDAEGRPVLDRRGHPVEAGGWGRAAELELRETEARWWSMLEAATCQVLTGISVDEIVRNAAAAITGPDRLLLPPDALFEARLTTRARTDAPALPPLPGPAIPDAQLEPPTSGLPVVHRFRFVTSLYASFFHHLYAWDGRVWRAGIDPQLLVQAAAGNDPSGVAETRAYEAVAGAVLGSAASSFAPSVEITRLEAGAAVWGLLVRSPEPLERERVDLAFGWTHWTVDASPAEGPARLAQVSFAQTRPDDEQVDLLLRETASLAGYRIELNELPDPGAAPDAGVWELVESFTGDFPGSRWTLWSETGTPNPGPWQLEGTGGLRADAPASLWVQLGGLFDGPVNALASEGGDVFAAGAFQHVGGLAALNIARWDGTQWAPLGGGLNGPVHALVLHGSLLYAGGSFSQADGQPTSHLAVWDRALGAWSPLDLPGDGTSGPVYALAVEGTDLWVGGDFWLPDSAHPFTRGANNLAVWDLTTRQWGFRRVQADGPVRALAVTATAVALAGDFQNALLPMFSPTSGFGFRPVASPGLAVLEQGTPRTFRAPDGRVRALTWRDGALFAAGAFTMIGDVAASRIARWNGASWSPLRDGVDGPVAALAADAEGILVCGSFALADGKPAAGAARWDPAAARWSTLPQHPGGELRALSSSSTGTAAAGGPAGNGWLARLRPAGVDLAAAGSPFWTDYRLVVRLDLDAQGAAGVALRWQDPENGYAFWLDRTRRTRRLVRRVNGADTVLWQDQGEAAGEETLTIDCLGDRLTGFRNGIELFDVQDSTFSSGRIALLVQGAGALFSEVRVGLPHWNPWYAFAADEPVLPAGTRLRITAGSIPPTSGPGLAGRAAAAPGQTGSIRFLPRAAELRLVGRDRRIEHAKTFLPASAYTRVGLRIVHRPDATGVVLLPIDGGPLPAGAWRLTLTYYRKKEGVRTFRWMGGVPTEEVRLDLY